LLAITVTADALARVKTPNQPYFPDFKAGCDAISASPVLTHLLTRQARLACEGASPRNFIDAVRIRQRLLETVGRHAHV
jgi:hypothetical protein